MAASTDALDERRASLTVPNIRTQPGNIVDAVAVSKTEGGSANRQTWDVSLLNPGEAVVFELFVYSDQVLEKVNLKVVPRKKDWKVVYTSPVLDVTREKESTKRLVLIVLLAPGAIAFLMIFFAYPFYRYQWKRRPDYREKYGSFRKFFNDHVPSALFTPPKPSTAYMRQDATFEEG